MATCPRSDVWWRSCCRAFVPVFMRRLIPISLRPRVPNPRRHFDVAVTNRTNRRHAVPTGSCARPPRVGVLPLRGACAMASPVGIERVVLVVLDGLRPDTIDVCGLENWKRLAARGASTLAGTTVGPSVTAAAMASLLTGVAPETHGLKSDKLPLPR